MSENTKTTLSVGPLLREALTNRGAGEDLDEALLRALKAHGHPNPAALLTAIGQVLDLEMKRTDETREQVAARLASEEQGPQVNFLQRGIGGLGNLSTTVTKTITVRANGKEYHSLEELPPELRTKVEQALPGGGGGNPTRQGKPSVRLSAKHTGCLLPMLVALLAVGLLIALRPL